MRKSCKECKFYTTHFAGNIDIGMCKKTKVLKNKEFHMYTCVDMRKYSEYCGKKASWFKKMVTIGPEWGI